MTQLLWLLWIGLTTPTFCDKDGTWTELSGSLETRLAEFVVRDATGEDPFSEGGGTWAFLDGRDYVEFAEQRKTVRSLTVEPYPHMYQVYTYLPQFPMFDCQGEITEDVAVRCDLVFLLVPRCEIVGVYNRKCHGDVK